MTNKALQKGGDNLQQINVGNITVAAGVSEERVRAIVDEELQIALGSFSEEANHVARQRNEKFSEKLISRMVEKKALEAFADPSFQILLVEAQKRAASTERECDYDLLTELMVRRFEVGGNRSERAGISKAVEIVDQISDEALLGLTVLYTVLNFTPASGDIGVGLRILDELYGKLLYAALPADGDWLDHLDVLGAIRLPMVWSTESFEECLIQKMPGYMVEGVERGSENFEKAVNMLHSVGLSSSFLVEHELVENRARLALVREGQIDGLMVGVDEQTARIVTQDQRKALRDVFALSSKSRISKQRVIEEIEKYASIKTLREWWNKLGNGFRITSVGRVLAHANAQRIDNTLPPLRFE